jgi:tetratricopeptide (TPR) repeat protein
LKKQQIILISGGIILLCAIYFFGNTVPPKKSPSPKMAGAAADSTFNIENVLAATKSRLTPEQHTRVEQLEHSIVRGDVKQQQANVYKQLASFYRDTAHLLLPFAYYTGESAKLENNEKSLTFAARFFLESARSQHDEGLKKWMAKESKQLFEKALVLNPDSDSLKVGLGSCSFFGATDNPMQGIMMIREVVERDPSNMYAQYMLGVGSLMSGQLDRAIVRLSLVAEKQPENVEVIIMLAEAYERKGDKPNAIKWYEAVKAKVNNPDIVQELDHRIQDLKK